MAVRPIPEGMHSITPRLTLKSCAEALEFYVRAFGAVEKGRGVDPSGKKIWHASFTIGDSTIFCSDEFPELGTAKPASLWLYTDDVDAAFERAVDAGATVLMPLADMFWGDRFGKLVDPWGVEWSLAQHVKDLSPEEMKKAREAAVAEFKKKQ